MKRRAFTGGNDGKQWVYGKSRTWMGKGVLVCDPEGNKREGVWTSKMAQQNGAFYKI